MRSNLIKVATLLVLLVGVGFIWLTAPKQMEATPVIGATIASSRPQPEPPKSLGEQYPGPWRDGFDRDIAITLGMNRIHGCGTFKYRPHAPYWGDYVVYCTRDDTTWIRYMVSVTDHKVSGPFAPDPTLN